MPRGKRSARRQRDTFRCARCGKYYRPREGSSAPETCSVERCHGAVVHCTRERPLRVVVRSRPVPKQLHGDAGGWTPERIGAVLRSHRDAVLGACVVLLLVVACIAAPNEQWRRCKSAEQCDGYGQGGRRGTCGPSEVCTVACDDDDDCDVGTCGPDDVAGVMVCTPEVAQ